MSISVPAETALEATNFLSLGELRRRILTDQSLPDGRRRDMASALASFVKALGRPAEMIAADPKFLRPELAKLTPAMVGHRPGRWRNILSLVTAALAHAGIVTIQGRIREAPSEDWLVALRLLGDGTQRHFHLWRFARYATLIGIGPASVDDALISRYRQDLEERSLVAEPARDARDAARHWNMAAAALADWPQQMLAVPDNRNVYSLPWEAFPATLREEVEVWGVWLGTDDPFLERDFAPLRPASVATRLRQLRMYLAALVHQGVNPNELESLAATVTPARATLGLRFFWERGGRKRSHHAYQLASLVLMLARHRAKLPAPDIERLRAMADKLRPSAEGITGRNVTRLRQLEDPQRLDALLALPSTLLNKVRRAGPPSIQLARQLQTAVAVEVLIHVPMRLRNLQQLRIGLHLLREADGATVISVPGESVKNGVAIHVRLPDAAARLIGVYVDRYRPLLAADGVDWLFPGNKPNFPKCADSLRSQIQKSIAANCGLPFHPHLFRHMAAWLILRANPGAHGQVQRVLGHKSLNSTMSFYSGLENTAALHHYDTLVGNLRQQAAGANSRMQRKGTR